MKPPAFAYHRATSADEAVELAARYGDEAKLLAGGQSLIPMMNMRLARPEALIDVGRVDELAFVDSASDREVVRIGALTRHITIERSTDVGLLDRLPMVPRAARLIGHLPIRSLGTFGGSIAHADPASEWCLLALLLDAEIVARGPAGERVIAARDFFQGFLTTALAPGEMLVEVRFRGRAPRGSLQEYARRSGDFAIVAAAASVDLDGGRCQRARIALGGVDATVVRVDAAEAVLEGAELSAEAIEEAAWVASQEISPGSDAHGSEAYRRQLAFTLTVRALREAAGMTDVAGTAGTPGTARRAKATEA